MSTPDPGCSSVSASPCDHSLMTSSGSLDVGSLVGFLVTTYDAGLWRWGGGGEAEAEGRPSQAPHWLSSDWFHFRPSGVHLSLYASHSSQEFAYILLLYFRHTFTHTKPNKNKQNTQKTNYGAVGICQGPRGNKEMLKLGEFTAALTSLCLTLLHFWLFSD